MPHWEVALDLDATIYLKTSDEGEQEGECTILVVSSGSYASNDVSAEQYISAGSALFKIYYRPINFCTGISIRRANVFFAETYIEYLFGVLFDGPKTSEWICQTMQDSCPETFALNGFTSISDCVAAMQSLESLGENADFSGNSRGCKNLHATFASDNPSGHCAHMSIVPQADSSGVVKCQDSCIP